MRKIISEVHSERFKKHSRVYRGVNRTFQDEELKLLLNSVEKLTYKLLFMLMGYCGFRVGEVVKLKLVDLDLEKRAIKVETEKQKLHVLDIQPIPESILPLLRLYIQKYQNRIEAHQGYLFPQDVKNNNAVTPEGVRKAFSYYRKICQLDRRYANANDERNPISLKQANRGLYELTPHSLRHWYKVKLDKANVPYGLIKSLMRHSGGDITSMYGHYNFEEKKKAVDEVFDNL